jgi:hypothetical protein
MKARARLSGSVRLGLCALSLLALAALTRPVRAQRVSLRFAQGTHLFRRILHDLNLRPLRKWEQLQEEPAEKLLIVLGETKSLNRQNLSDFVQDGGAVLVATDRDCDLQPFGVEVVGDLVVTSDSTYAYKSSDCIFVRPRDKDSSLFENLTVQKKTSRVATNRPGYLKPRKDCELQLLATFPYGCYAEDTDVPRFLSGDNLTQYLRKRYRNKILPFAVGGDWGQGRILILSDHSVFINAMMWQPDIENFDFAYNCVNWLTQGGKRKQVLFLEEGEIQQTFEIPLKEPPLPSLKAIVEAVDKGLGELERDDAFNRAIQNAVTSLTSPTDKWLRAVIWISTAFLGMFALARLSQARHRPEKTVPAPAGMPFSNLFAQRHQSMKQEGNYWESARALARQGLESALGVPAQSNRQPSDGGASPPSVKVQGGWWRTWRVRRRFHRLWGLAYGTEPVRISLRQLSRLGREIENMKAVLARSNFPPAPHPIQHPVRETKADSS